MFYALLTSSKRAMCPAYLLCDFIILLSLVGKHIPTSVSRVQITRRLRCFIFKKSSIRITVKDVICSLWLFSMS